MIVSLYSQGHLPRLPCIIGGTVSEYVQHHLKDLLKWNLARHSGEKQDLLKGYKVLQLCAVCL